MATLGYGTVGSNRLDQAKAFYDALLGSIGLTSVYEAPTGGRIYGKNGDLIFGVLAPHDGCPASVGNGSMLAFRFDKPEQVSAFHAKAMQLGGKDEGAPGERAPQMFFAYFRDLDGNKLCAYSLG
jgi:catechol 2,3-dioxygenase-like lactoylglutathione lyase family enzyme